MKDPRMNNGKCRGDQFSRKCRGDQFSRKCQGDQFSRKCRGDQFLLMLFLVMFSIC